MEYNLLFKSAECIALLDTYDIVGTGAPNGGGEFKCMKDKNLKPLALHFAGNFWWSTGKYFLSLPKKVEDGYCDPESYIFMNDPKYMALDADKAAKKDPQPEINLRADKSVRYDSVAQVLAASRRAGLTKLGFVTEPD